MTLIFTINMYPDTYLDSVLQMSGTREMEQCEGVQWASAAMSTVANVKTLISRGFPSAELTGAGPGDLFIAVESLDPSSGEIAIESARQVMFAARNEANPMVDESPTSLDEALTLQPNSNIAIISVPGEYASLEAHKALTQGLDVLLFSDGVTPEDEIALKDHAAARNLLVMGPGAGTASLAGIGLGFANVVRQGPVGVVAAAGTGAQEVMALLHRWGIGVSHVIGLGGRDLNDEIDGRMARLAIHALRNDPQTAVILFVSKPPSQRVAREVMALADGSPMVAAFMGIDMTTVTPPGVILANTLESGVLRTLEVLGESLPDTSAIAGPDVRSTLAKISADRTLIRGLYSGGTLCYEALVILAETFTSPVYSNTPIDKKLGMPAPVNSSTLLDLGEEEYTRGRPHPMIDPVARVEFLEEAGADPQVAVIVMDLVLGHGAHPDPAAVFAPICQRIMESGGPQIVVYVLGTDADPQHYTSQVAALSKAGCLVPMTNARAAILAAHLAERNMSHETLAE